MSIYAADGQPFSSINRRGRLSMHFAWAGCRLADIMPRRSLATQLGNGRVGPLVMKWRYKAAMCLVLMIERIANIYRRHFGAAKRLANDLSIFGAYADARRFAGSVLANYGGAAPALYHHDDMMGRASRRVDYMLDVDFALRWPRRRWAPELAGRMWHDFWRKRAPKRLPSV